MRRTNGELVAGWGNLVNRTASMIHKRFGAVPEPGDLEEIDRSLLDSIGEGFDVVGGLTMGADPVAAAILHASAAAGRPVDACVVRKEAKTHGLHKRIEGPGVAGRRVLVVEDTSTTGGSALTAVEALREAGATVVGVADIVDRSGRAVAEAMAESGLEYRFVYSAKDLGL